MDNKLGLKYDCAQDSSTKKVKRTIKYYFDVKKKQVMASNYNIYVTPPKKITQFFKD